MKIMFMGTPAFAVPSLKALIDHHYNVVAVVTAPDKPAGRGLKLHESEVKKFALQHHLPVLQPTNLKSDDFYEQLQFYNPDLIVVVAFRMLPEKVWSYPKIGTMNVHASLLPDYRGAAPINWVLINGEKITGVTTFWIDKEIDTGKILLQKSIEIMPEWNAGDLHDKLMYLGADLLIETIQKIENQNIKPIDQDISLYRHHAPKLNNENTQIHWNKTDIEIHNLIRGLAPYPGAWTVFNNLKLKIFRSQITSLTSDLPSGTMFAKNKTIYVVTGNQKLLSIFELQLEGKSKVSATDFINGHFKNQEIYKL
jgi:methionyl-tRNA formyltransferase